jgi:hypothetical protein
MGQCILQPRIVEYRVQRCSKLRQRLTALGWHVAISEVFPCPQGIGHRGNDALKEVAPGYTSSDVDRCVDETSSPTIRCSNVF